MISARVPTVTGLAAIALLAAVTADVLIGQAFGPDGVLRALSDTSSREHDILLHTRLARVATAATSGFALGLGGFALQVTLGNVLASPDLLGVNQGAVVGVLVSISLGVVTVGQMPGSLLAALVGGLLGGTVTFLAASRLARDNVVIVGVVTGALFGGVTVMVLSLRSSAFGEVLRWLVGSVSGQTWPTIIPAAGWIAVWGVIVLILSPRITLMATGADHANAAGLPSAVWRPTVLLCVVCLTAGAVALAGAMSFVGLVAGHIGRRSAGIAGVSGFLIAGVSGAALLCGCDALAQTLTLAFSGSGSRVGLPAGAVAAVGGAIALIVIIRIGRAAP